MVGSFDPVEEPLVSSRDIVGDGGADRETQDGESLQIQLTGAGPPSVVIPDGPIQRDVLEAKKIEVGQPTDASSRRLNGLQPPRATPIR